MKEATVVKNAGSHFLLSELPLWKPFPAVLRGRTRLGAGSSTNPVAVGDKVYFDLPDTGIPDESNPAIISKILPRTNYVIRRSTNLSRRGIVLLVPSPCQRSRSSVVYCRYGLARRAVR